MGADGIDELIWYNRSCISSVVTFVMFGIFIFVVWPTGFINVARLKVSGEWKGNARSPINT